MFNKLKLKAKMLISICSVILITFSITIAFIAVKSGTMAKKNALEKAEEMAYRYSLVIKSKIDIAMHSARIVAQTIEGIKISGHIPKSDSLDMMLKQILEKNGEISGIWIMLERGTFYEKSYAPWFYRKDNTIVSEPTPDEKYDEAMVNEYYSIPKESKKESLLEPYIDPIINIMMTTASVPVIDPNDGKTCIGVVGADITLDDMNQIIRDIRPFGTGSVSIVSSTNKYVAHIDKSKLGKDINDTDNQSVINSDEKENKEQKDKDTNNTSKIEEIQTISVPIQIGAAVKPWTLIVNIPVDKILEDARNITLSCLFMGILSIAFTAIAVTLFSGTIIKPVNAVIENIRQVTNGNLNIRLKVQNNDEIGDLAVRFNEFIENLQIIVRQIGKNAITINSSSDNLLSISTDLYGSIGNHSKMADNIASSAGDMTLKMKEVTDTMQKASSTVSKVASMAEEMTSTINDITKNTEQSKAISDSAVSKSGVVNQKMGALAYAAKEIGKVIETITEISSQTNLLALNATIEASRAGEAGKGFAVVAGEIKNLAKQTADATLIIKQQIQEMQSTTTSTITEINEISDVINNIDQIIETIATAVSEQSTATIEIAQNISNTAAGIKNVNTAVNQSSTFASEIGTDIIKMNSEIQNINSRSGMVKVNAEELKGMAATLNLVVGKFEG
ncbi:MAG: methyl-accepting chemotaxis protein [Desulfamplus sp.]|nr:methyl-accepting chemotaxis protein [Desulfamplus sp.]